MLISRKKYKQEISYAQVQAVGRTLEELGYLGFPVQHYSIDGETDKDIIWVEVNGKKFFLPKGKT